MDDTFYSAKLKRTSFKKETPYVVTRKVNNKYKDWIFEHIFKLFQKWGHIKPYMEDVVIEKFDFAPSKKKLITDKIIEEMNKRENYFYDRLNPSNHIVIMGEHTFFEIVQERRDNNSPFFGDNTTFMSNDIYYNDAYSGRRVMNFQCHIVRGMQGFAFVPRVIVEVRKNENNYDVKKDYTI